MLNMLLMTSTNLTPLGDGIYIDSSLIVAENAEYTLSFLFNSQVVSAYTYIPSKPRNFKQSVTSIYVTRIDSTSGFPTGGFSMPDPVELTWDNPDHDYYLAIVENVETTLDPIRDFGDNDPPSNIFRKSPTTAAATEIRSQEFQYFGTHRIIYIMFYRIMLRSITRAPPVRKTSPIHPPASPMVTEYLRA